VLYNITQKTQVLGELKYSLIYSIMADVKLASKHQIGITVSLRSSGGSKNVEKEGKTIYQPHPHISQMHTTIYRPFTRKKAAFWREKLSQ